MEHGHNAVCGVRILFRDVCTDFVDIVERFRVGPVELF